MVDATDNFNRAGPALGSNWTLGINSIVISASVVAHGGTAASDNSAWWDFGAFAGDQYAQVELRIDEVDGGGPIVRHQSGANTFYLLHSDGHQLAVYEVTAGTFVIMGSIYSNNPVLGDVIRLNATGSTLTPSLNGTSLATRSDSSITGGSPGLYCFDTAMELDNWLGGPLLPASYFEADPPVSR